MTQPQCAQLNGSYRGGATCTDDPCNYIGPPPGFEIIELSPGMENQGRRWPYINNCGEVVWHMGGPETLGNNEVFLYDNGRLQQITTDNANGPPWTPNWFPTISDSGNIAWTHWPEAPSTSFPFRQLKLLNVRTNEIAVLYSDSSIITGFDSSINAVDHLALGAGFLESACDIDNSYVSHVWYFDGETSRPLVQDRLSNQGVRINDKDEITFTQYHFPCIGGPWDSSIRLYRNGAILTLPSSVGSTERQGPDVNSTGTVVWQSGIPRVLERWSEGTTSVVGDGDAPAINAGGSVASSFRGGEFPYWVLSHQSVPPRRLTSDADLENHIDNNMPDINDAGEIAWGWTPNGQVHGPWGTRLMRRIRTGDYDLDMDVDRADFGEFKYCFTGSVPTDHLCQCRFYDIDHDRDVDFDDYALFLSNYTDTIEDCNGNAVSDFDDILSGVAEDCNANGVPDSCDVAEGLGTLTPALSLEGRGGLTEKDPAPAFVAEKNPPVSPLRKRGSEEGSTVRMAETSAVRIAERSAQRTLRDGGSADADGNGVPDECQCPEFQAVHVNPNYDLFNRKNRYLSFTPRTAYWRPGTALIGPDRKGVRAAIRVTLTNVDGYSSFNGQARWVGPPTEYVDATHVSGKMWAAALQCTPYYRYWGDVDLLHVYGDAIVPSSNYALQIVAEDCSGVLLNESKFSPAAVIPTQPRWGDVIEPFGVVNFQDVSAVVKTFQGKKGSPIKAAAQLQGNIPNPSTSVNFLDVSACVSAFQGRPYVTMFAGPTVCP